MQTVTYMDPAGNVATYAIYDVNSRGEYHWSTDYGDSGFEMSSSQAQISARTKLKARMATQARTDQTSRYRSVAKQLQRPARRPRLPTVKWEDAPGAHAPLEPTLPESVRSRLGRFAAGEQRPPQTDCG
jgi:hypothetical protein